MNFDRNVSCFIAVYALMDNDFFNQAVEGGSVQFRDVGVFLNGFYPLAGVIRKPDFIGQLLPAFFNLCRIDCMRELAALMSRFRLPMLVCMPFFSNWLTAGPMWTVGILSIPCRA